jgi:malate-CoA ligase subunit beta
MDIHEHQAKDILAGFGVPVPKGGLAYSPEQAAYRARSSAALAWSRRRSIPAAAARPAA